MLEVRNLTRSGVHGASFRVAPGECLLIQGPSGAGKSLLLRAIVDLDPNAGEVWLDGVERARFPAPQWRRAVAYLPAEPGWWGDTVGEHFASPAAALPGLAALGLPDAALTWPVARASTGERMRLALVRALAGAPRVLLLDEPTAALDPASVAAVEALIAQYRQRGLTVIWVSHDAAQARRVATRTLYCRDGRFSDEDENE
ncbi:ABC transporter ATP-binding protein [Paludibacterium yongneupense]|nr:ABC transporter ATP-binding protein [Paludibacterium yongneupense]